MACAHCGKNVVMLKARTRPRGHCNRCARYICDPCSELVRLGGNDACTFFEEMLDVSMSSRNVHGVEDMAFLNHEGKLSEDVKMLRDKKRIVGIGFGAPQKEAGVTDSGIVLAKK